MKSIQVRTVGSPEVLEVREVPDPVPQISRVYPLRNAADSHRDLESRKTTGKLLLSIGISGLTYSHQPGEINEQRQI
jgi:NADPH:quinone reductase-like Zn-dependent oxidoreductase